MHWITDSQPHSALFKELRRRVQSRNQGGYIAAKATQQNAVRYGAYCLPRISEKETNSGHSCQSGRCIQQECNSNCWRTSDNMVSAWCSQDGLQQHFRKKGDHVTWKLDRSPHLNNWQWVFHKAFTYPQSSTMTTQRDWQIYLNSNGISWTFTLADDGLMYKTACYTHTPVTAVQKQLKKKVTMAPRDREHFEITPSMVQFLWCIFNDKAVGHAMPAVSFNREVIERTVSDTSRSTLTKCWKSLQNAGWINKTQVQERTVCAKSDGCKRHWTMSSIPAVSECDSQCHWLWIGSHNPVTVQPAEAW